MVDEDDIDAPFRGTVAALIVVIAFCLMAIVLAVILSP
jgi:hypothetical protein